MLQKIRRQFFSFFMPLLHLQLYRGLCFMASMALRHSPCASGPGTALKLLSRPATHCLIVRYLVLQVGSLRHCSLAFTQSRWTGRAGVLPPSPLKVSSGSGSEADSRVSTVIASLSKMRKDERKLYACLEHRAQLWRDG